MLDCEVLDYSIGAEIYQTYEECFAQCQTGNVESEEHWLHHLFNITFIIDESPDWHAEFKGLHKKLDSHWEYWRANHCLCRIEQINSISSLSWIDVHPFF